MPAEGAPFFREVGEGPGVVCLHSNASTSSQWRSLMDALAPCFHVVAPDGMGAGRSPPWPGRPGILLRDEAAFLEPVFAHAGEPLTLVGHSYGAAVALVAAVLQPRRVRALALYEPTLFSLLATSPAVNDAAGIEAVVQGAGAACDAGDLDLAAQWFIDYWMGPGSWARTPEARKPAIAASMANVRGWAHALMHDPTPLAAFAALDVPVLYMTGGRSPASSLGVARLLTATLPRVERVQFDELGHMGPITHPEVVNAAILRFLERVHTRSEAVR